MSQKPPDRACVQKGSRFYYPDCALIGISINGEIHQRDVVEYSVSGGWARCKARDPSGNFYPNAIGSGPRIVTVHGVIKVWFKGSAQEAA